MAILRILSSEGDTATSFTEEAHEEAAQLFHRLQGSYVGFKIQGMDTPAIRLNAFDPLAEEIIMIPKVQGG